jgi:hypothetical protein
MSEKRCIINRIFIKYSKYTCGKSFCKDTHLNADIYYLIYFVTQFLHFRLKIKCASPLETKKGLRKLSYQYDTRQPGCA